MNGFDCHEKASQTHCLLLGSTVERTGSVRRDAIVFYFFDRIDSEM